MGKNDIPAGNHSDYKYDGLQGYAGRYPDSFKGLNTGTLTALLDESETPTFALSVMYYDYRGRPAQVNSGQRLTKEYYCYTFGGQVKHKKVMHAKSDKAPTLFDHYTYTYDHAQRLVKTEHRITHHSTTSDWITMAEYTYDDLGRLQEKDLHGVNPVTYDYNIRSWTTGIGSNLFTQNLYYNTGNGTGNYNGNISRMTWTAAGETSPRGYHFVYDGLNRLTAANYGEGTNLASNPDRFTEKVTRYDKHGNIMALQRYGKIASSYGLIDDLAFGYAGNRMTFVNDAIQESDVDQSFHFNDRSSSNTGNEFEYDGNGNIVKDNNKNITDIQYNVLNLPKRVLLSGGGSATYIYDASGAKYKVIYQGGGENKNTEYSSNVIYENGELDKIFTEEGYITFNGNIPTYHYYLTDHLGNNRVVMNQDGTIEQVNHYYPFGGLFDQTAEDLQAYKFGGKELDRTYGLDLYDYSARYMDGAIGRFTTMDPLSEKYYAISPYAYCANNPVRFVDPTGEDIWDFLRGIGEGAKNKVVTIGKAIAHPIETAGKIISGIKKMSLQEGIAAAADVYTGGIVSSNVDFVSAVVSDVSGGDGSATGKVLGGVAVDVGIAAAGAKVGSAIAKGASKAANTVQSSVKTSSGYRYMSSGELNAIKETGFLRGGNPGETFFTKDLYKSASKAQSRLALPNTPEIRVEFKILNNPTMQINGSKVAPNYGMPGKGAEFMTKDPVKVKIINAQPLNK